MAPTLSWNLHGNDQLSSVLEHLDRTLGTLARRLDGVTGDAKKMGTALGEAENPARRVGSAASETSTRLEGLSSGLGRVIDKTKLFAFAVTAAAVTAAGATGLFAIKSAMDMQTSRVAFEQMLGSAQKAASFLDNLAKFAEATPFQLKDLETYGSRLLAVGVAAGDIIPLLKRIGDGTASIGTGAYGIELAVNALNQMKLASHVGLIDLRQLGNAGVPIFNALAASLHTTEAKIIEMVSAGKISVDEVFAAIKDGVGPTFAKINGMMDKQSATLEGKLSNFKDKASRTLGQAFLPALDPLGRLVDRTAAGIPIVINRLKSMGHQIGDIFKGSDVPERIFSSLKELGAKVLPVLELAWKKIVNTIRDNKEGLEKFGRFIADVIIPIIGATLPAAIEVTTGAFLAIIWTVSKIVDAVQFLTDAFLTNLGIIVHAADASFGWIPGIGPKLHEAASKFDDWANHIHDQLKKLDGTEINVSVKLSAANEADWSALRNAERQTQPRATGGPVWAGSAYTMNEFGPEPFIAATTGTVAPYQANSPSGAAPLDITLRIVRQRPDGGEVYEELHRFKANSGKRSLEFEG